MSPSPVVAIKWMPNSENLFIAAHMDGTMVVYDKEKDDAPITADETVPLDDGLLKMDVKKSLQAGASKMNPVAVYRINMDRPHAMAFSPDDNYIAVVSDDGTLRIVDINTEAVLDIYRSYYGGLTTVAWSPDGKYIITGGQDDLVSIWSFPDRALVARCQGHCGWVTNVQFDPWRCDDRGYRFGSVGEDCRLLLWDFSPGMLIKPKVVPPESVTLRGETDIPRYRHFIAVALPRAQCKDRSQMMILNEVMVSFILFSHG